MELNVEQITLFVRNVDKFSFVLAVIEIIGCQLSPAGFHGSTLYISFIAIDFRFIGVGHAVCI